MQRFYSAKRIFTAAAIAASALALTVATTDAQADTLIDFSFDSTANDTGPAIQQVFNGQGTGGSANLTTGLITTNSNANSGYAFNNVTTVSLTGYNSFTATFVIDSINLGTTEVADLVANGMFFGVVAGTNATSTTSFYGAQQTYIGYVPGSLNRGSHVVATRVDSGSNVNDDIASTQPTDDSLKDGFTVSLTLNNNDAWSITSTGLSNELSDNGTAAGMWSAMSGGVGLWTGLQTQSGQLDISRMTLTAVPEPGSLALLGLGGLMMIKRRRRA